MFATNAHWADGTGGSSEMASTTKTDISLVTPLGRLESGMQLLKAVLVPETCEESSTVYVLLKGLQIKVKGFQKKIPPPVLIH